MGLANVIDLFQFLLFLQSEREWPTFAKATVYKGWFKPTERSEEAREVGEANKATDGTKWRNNPPPTKSLDRLQEFFKKY